jgi:hypothetical protein
MVHAILVGEQKQGSLRFHLTEHFLPVGWVFKKMQSQGKSKPCSLSPSFIVISFPIPL